MASKISGLAAVWLSAGPALATESSGLPSIAASLSTTTFGNRNNNQITIALPATNRIRVLSIRWSATTLNGKVRAYFSQKIFLPIALPCRYS
jgi:hypothetical protein